MGRVSSSRLVRAALGVISAQTDDDVMRRFAATKPQTFICKNEQEFEFLDVPPPLGILWRASPDRRGVPLKLLLRRCHPVLFNMMWEHNTHSTSCHPGVVFLGNPGIGKTGFLWYILWRLLQEQASIIVKVPIRSTYTCIYWQDGRLRTQDVPTLKRAEERTSPGRWYIADQFVPQTDWAPSGACKFVLTCSPLKSNFAEFSKGQHICKLYVPVWHDDEIFALNEQQFGHPAQDVKDRIDKWGGIPRHVLSQVNKGSQADLERSAGLVRDADKILHLHGLPEDQIHQVFHMHVDETSYETYSLKFASDYVENLVYSNLQPAELYKFIQNPQQEFIRDIQGKVFEHYIRDIVMPKGGKFKYRVLGEDGHFGLEVQEAIMDPMPGKIELGSAGGGGHKAVFPTNVSEKHKNYLFYPKSPRNAEWDLIAHGSIFQITVSEEWSLEIGEALVRAVEFLRQWHEQIVLYYFVPKHVLSSFKIDWFYNKSKGPQKAAEGTEGFEADSNKSGDEGFEAGSNRSGDDAVVRKEQASEVDIGLEGSKVKGIRAERKARIVMEKKDRLRKLNVVVRVATFDPPNLCPRCKGAGVVDDGGPISQAVESLTAVISSKESVDKAHPNTILDQCRR